MWGVQGGFEEVSRASGRDSCGFTLCGRDYPNMLGSQEPLHRGPSISANACIIQDCLNADGSVSRVTIHVKAAGYLAYFFVCSFAAHYNQRPRCPFPFNARHQCFNRP